MCKAGVINAEPSEDNSISAVKLTQITIAERASGQQIWRWSRDIRLSFRQLYETSTRAVADFFEDLFLTIARIDSS